ncbi:hypothetical protein KDA_40260 [Dictyobacter alpinus]|uniref:DUF4020 domain-containing protein n=1 Tax=Dictyobacter alpinus TaxID=2014873 RepID=A0A402BB73_9CHLR|nr:hypothetical protein [Dictyobacter alpinus]GCE28542.1 hypothetical protein KDA_40260 [Dictyobacter alpinus]
MRNEKEYMELAFTANRADYVLEYELEDDFREFFTLWGGFDIKTLQQVVIQTQDEKQKRIALAAIGYAQHAESLPFLLPYLYQGPFTVRFMGAWSLWESHRELAFSMLSPLLLVDLLAAKFNSGELLWIFSKYGGVLYDFVQWKDPRIIPLLRQALIATWKMRQVLAEHRLNFGDDWDYKFVVESFGEYQDILAKSLGEMHAMGALTGIEFDDIHRAKTMIFLIMGYLHEKIGNQFSSIARDICWEKSHPTRLMVIGVLREKFGLQEDECQSCLNLFCKAMDLSLE